MDEAATTGALFAAVESYLYALDARTGKPIATFGTNGRIDLRNDLGRDPADTIHPADDARRHLPRSADRRRPRSEGLPASPGDVRAYDARTGALRWTFHTIPHPGRVRVRRPWPKDAWTYNGGANNWAGMALDEARGIVYVPTGSAAADFYGANRPGDNLFANSLIALDAATGKRLWHFQTVRHDIWDRDLPSPPSLVTVTHDGRTIDAVAQTTQARLRLPVRPRRPGSPLFPIEYRKFPPSDVPGEVTADTQPMPVEADAVRAAALTEEMLTTRTPEAHDWALARVPEVPERRPVRCRSTSARRRSCFPVSTAAPNGAARHSILRPAGST